MPLWLLALALAALLCAVVIAAMSLQPDPAVWLACAAPDDELTREACALLLNQPQRSTP